MAHGFKCAKCKGFCTAIKSLKLRSADTAHKGVCIPCYDKIMSWRTSRGLDQHLREVKK